MTTSEDTKPALTPEAIKRIDKLIQEAALRCGTIFDVTEGYTKPRDIAAQCLAKEAFRILDNALSELNQGRVEMGRFLYDEDMPEWRKGIGMRRPKQEDAGATEA